jgi:hypothetical protein
MRLLMKLISALGNALLLINLIGPVGAAIWLAVLREWRMLGQGILVALVGGLLLSIAMLPGLLLDVPAVLFCKRRNKAGFYFFGFLSLCYTLGVLTLWCIAVLTFFVRHASQSSFIPALIWSYGSAIAPVAWLAEKDREARSTGAMISTFFCEIAYLLVVLTSLVTRVSPFELSLLLFGVFMLIALILESSMVVEEYKELPREVSP